MSPSDKLIEEALEAGATILKNTPGHEPQRRIFKIDVSNVVPEDMESVITDLSELIKRKPQPDPITGNYDLKFELTNPLQDIYFPPSLEDQAFTKQLNDDTDCILRVLNWIEEDKKKDGYDPSVDIIYWALKFMKEDPTISIGEAMMMGFAEWDK